MTVSTTIKHTNNICSILSIQCHNINASVITKIEIYGNDPCTMQCMYMQAGVKFIF